MAIDPDEEAKRRTLKRNQQHAMAQEYMEQQHELQKKTVSGKIGAHRVKPTSDDRVSKVASNSLFTTKRSE